MTTRIKLSKEISIKLDYLSRKLILRRNIICRIAIGRSLVDRKSVKNYTHLDSQGYELNRITIIGRHADLFRALINQHERERIGDFEYFSKYVRNHIARGVSLLHEEYERVNSPTEFLLGLIDFDIREENKQVDLF